MPRKGFNGYPSWNQWNVSLWINNDFGLYSWARRLVQLHGKRKAAGMMLETLDGMTTPDGANYNITSIRGALRGII